METTYVVTLRVKEVDLKSTYEVTEVEANSKEEAINKVYDDFYKQVEQDVYKYSVYDFGVVSIGIKGVLD